MTATTRASLVGVMVVVVTGGRTVNNLLSHLKLTYRTRLSPTIRDGLA